MIIHHRKTYTWNGSLLLVMSGFALASFYWPVPIATEQCCWMVWSNVWACLWSSGKLQPHKGQNWSGITQLQLESVSLHHNERKTIPFHHISPFCPNYRDNIKSQSCLLCSFLCSSWVAFPHSCLWLAFHKGWDIAVCPAICSFWHGSMQNSLMSNTHSKHSLVLQRIIFKVTIVYC